MITWNTIKNLRPTNNTYTLHKTPARNSKLTKETSSCIAAFPRYTRAGALQ